MSITQESRNNFEFEKKMGSDSTYLCSEKTCRECYY